jgi:peptidoglycan/LPS O-acetylase OafA/YrhL
MGSEEERVAAMRLVPAMGQGRHRRLRGIGAAAAATLAGIHVDRLMHAAREAAYLGVLFGVAAASFGWVAVQLLRGDDIEGWVAGVALALGVATGYVLSCTIGLPGLSPEPWSGLGNTSTSLAAVLLIAATARSRILASEHPSAL